MKKLKATIFGIVFVAITSSIYFIYPQESARSTDNNPFVVTMKNLEYSATEINIKKGQIIKFINEGSEEYWPASAIHPTHQIYPEFDSAGPIKSGESWSFEFNKIGSWRFHDHIQYPNITGVVNVAE